MAHVLAADIGNTTARFGLLETAKAGAEGAPKLLSACEVTTRQPITTDEARMQLGQILSELTGKASSRGGTCPSPEGSILSCVVPTLTDAWHRALADTVLGRQLVVGPGLRSGVKLRFNDPSEVGPDRIADAVAARAAYGAPVVVVDLGTTTNFEVIDASGAFCGGIIAPGVALGARSLAEAAARLPIIELRAPERVLGRSTREAMQSGVVLGEAARIDGLLDAVLAELADNGKRARARLGEGSAAHENERDEADAGAATPMAIPIVITGENADAIAALLHHQTIVDDALTLRGLALIWQANQRG